jgi:hypothetical protein
VAWVRERTIPSDSHLSAKLVPTFTEIRCHVVSATDPYSRILGLLDRSRYFFFQLAPQLYSRGWVDPVPDPLLLRKSDSAGNRTRTSGSVARNSDHWNTKAVFFTPCFYINVISINITKLYAVLHADCITIYVFNHNSIKLYYFSTLQIHFDSCPVKLTSSLSNVIKSLVWSSTLILGSYRAESVFIQQVS